MRSSKVQRILKVHVMSQKLLEEHYFMKVFMAFEKEPDFLLDSRQLKAIIVHALLALHGQVGAAVQVDILQCHSESGSTLTSIVRIPYHELAKVWSALTLLGTYNGFTCIIRVEKASPSLLSLIVSSREFDFISEASCIKIKN